MISFKQTGNFSKFNTYTERLKKTMKLSILDKYGKEGVAALAAATPIDSGETANSWQYKIETSKMGSTLYFYNTNVQNGVPIAIIIQYGHGTGTGGYVQGLDYINPAIKPIFDKILNDVWKEVTAL